MIIRTPSNNHNNHDLKRKKNNNNNNNDNHDHISGRPPPGQRGPQPWSCWVPWGQSLCSEPELHGIFERSMRLNYMGTVHAIKAIASMHVTYLRKIDLGGVGKPTAPLFFLDVPDIQMCVIVWDRGLQLVYEVCNLLMIID